MQKVRLTTYGKILIVTVIAVLIFSTVLIVKNAINSSGVERNVQAMDNTSKEKTLENESLIESDFPSHAVSKITSQSLKGTFLTIYFYPDLDTIKEESYQTLNFLVILSNIFDDATIHLEGNTASISDCDDSDFDRDLSYRRAKAVADFLIAKGVAPDRIKAVGNGSVKPAAANDSEEGRRLNRRTDVFFE